MLSLSWFELSTCPHELNAVPEGSFPPTSLLVCSSWASSSKHNISFTVWRTISGTVGVLVCSHYIHGSTGFQFPVKIISDEKKKKCCYFIAYAREQVLYKIMKKKRLREMVLAKCNGNLIENCL